MGYRTDKARARRWQQWRATYYDDLLRLPLPPFLYELEENWKYFLEHGYHPDDPTHFVIDHVRPAEAAALLAFFQGQAAAGEYTGIVLNWLRHHREEDHQ